MPEIDYNYPRTYTVKYLPDPTAWNGPPWLFEGSTPEEIEAMQQGAIDEALQAEIEAEAETEAHTQAIFYEHRDFGHPAPVGTVTLDHGVAQIPPELTFINTVPVEDWDTGRILLPTDGAAYIKALPNAFSGTYVWAELSD
jgi:hypothetical protein